jgi:glutamine amidotransferase
MQLFFQQSEEGPGRGLGLFNGKTVRLRGSVKVPHMGWNTLRIAKQSELFEDVSDESYVYFVHSLYPIPSSKRIVAAETEYGVPFTSAVASANICGTQFHPEKSGEVGLKILGNFAKMLKR